MKLIQLNVNRSKASHDNIHQIMCEQNIDIILGQEPNREIAKKHHSDENLDSFIWANNKSLTTNIHIGTGYISALLSEDTEIYSCYFSSNKPTVEFEDFLANLTGSLKQSKYKNKLVCGDFNCRSVMFGATNTDKKGKIIEEWLALNELVPVNQGIIPTFRNRNGSSWVDLTMATSNLYNQIKNWTIKEDWESMSPHRIIYFEISHIKDPGTTKQQITKGKKWKVNDIGLGKLALKIEAEKEKIEISNPSPEQFISTINDLCNRTMQKQGIKRGKAEKYIGGQKRLPSSGTHV